MLSQIHKKRWKVEGYCPFCALENLIKEVFDQVYGSLAKHSNKRKIITPKEIVMGLKKLWKQYRFGRQEDSHEFLIILLQGILRASFGNNSKLTRKYEHLTMVYRIFAGKLRSQVKWLSCAYCSNTIEPFLTLSLDVSRGNTFEECVRKFCQPEYLEGENKYQCGGCNKLSRAKKQMTFFKPPRILIVHFLRFTMTGRKIDKHIKFPKCFNLRVFVSENVDAAVPREKQTDHIYSLYGVIVHAGKGVNSGHYYSFVKKDNKWYRWNDESITEVHNIEQVLEQRAYLLFYQYRLAKPKSDAKNKTPLFTPAFNKTKSISIEIKETHENKNNNIMPLSGFFDDKQEVNSEEEEEKLVQKEKFDPEKEKEQKYLEYILQNFEDVDFGALKELDLMRNLSVVSLRDDMPPTPELKQMISHRLLTLTKKNEFTPTLSRSDSDIKVPDIPKRFRNDENMENESSSSEKLKKRKQKELNKLESETTAESSKTELIAKVENNSHVSDFSDKKKKKRKRNKNRNNNNGDQRMINNQQIIT